ncbi:unnamed protein product [Angiostrongylus costaricensis]|uniref:PX domain-containing protein n=1 Tax=Angiostrongylus costaricensis TaxID=334426 RepID=A0A0R3Q1R1_ANGCS|nr:unnamed protein product [Angiostrongylus costaricensis]
MEFRDMQLEVLSINEARREVLINLRKRVSASIHHPAFSVDQRIRLVHVRDEIRAGGFAFVRRFRATQLDVNDIDNFLVEMIWSDGERTFVGRTRNDINTLHHRLLDMFGGERREMKQAQDANAEQPESAWTSALRILPHFSMDCSQAAVIQYINALSDLPARIMLSSVIYQQFFASRLSSEELEVAERSIPTTPSLQRYTHPVSSPVIYPVASAALAYSSRDAGIQVMVIFDYIPNVLLLLSGVSLH